MFVLCVFSVIIHGQFCFPKLAQNYKTNLRKVNIKNDTMKAQTAAALIVLRQNIYGSCEIIPLICTLNNFVFPNYHYFFDADGATSPFICLSLLAFVALIHIFF